MTQEKLHNAPEHDTNPEALEATGMEHKERLRKSLEHAETKHKESHEESLERVQREAIERANSLKEVAKAEKSPAQKRVKLFTRQQREVSFKRQMDTIQAEMQPGERRFSKVIHNKSIEQASDAIGSTIARPNALLAGSISAFILVTIVYLVAKHYGYQLSGFETIGAFVLGWMLGLGYDYVKLLVTGKKR